MHIHSTLEGSTILAASNMHLLHSSGFVSGVRNCSEHRKLYIYIDIFMLLYSNATRVAIEIGYSATSPLKKLSGVKQRGLV